MHCHDRHHDDGLFFIIHHDVRYGTRSKIQRHSAHSILGISSRATLCADRRWIYFVSVGVFDISKNWYKITIYQYISYYHFIIIMLYNLFHRHAKSTDECARFDACEIS